MKRLILMVCACAMLAGCGSTSSSGSHSSIGKISAEEKAVRERGDYWQRSDSVSALYLTGPKAQHQLNMDIASCVAEVRELVRLGSIRKATPPATIGMDSGMRAGWTGPTRDGPLYTEYTNFQDFDGCMKYKGWDRVNYVRPVTARAASTNYVTTILGHPFGWGGGSSSPVDDAEGGTDDSFNR